MNLSEFVSRQDLHVGGLEGINIVGNDYRHDLKKSFLGVNRGD